MTKEILFILLCLFLSNVMIGQEAYKDCSTAEQVLQLANYEYSDIPGIGDEYEKIGVFKDGYEIRETNSVWLSWEVAKGGDLYFDIIPLNDNDDIDFVLYRSGAGCDGKEQIRSVLSGVNVITNLTSEPCFGPTGLSPYSADTDEGSGCADGDDNYARSVATSNGEIYYLLINNYYDKTGFKLRFHGSTQFTNPEDAQVYGKLKLESMSVYPNPAIDVIQVDISGDNLSGVSLSVTDMQGHIMQTTTEVSASSTLNISELPSGTYNVIALYGNQEREVRRFIKQ